MGMGLLVLLTIAVVLRIHVTQCATGTAYCSYTTNPDAEFAIEFELTTEADMVTNITFYDPSEQPTFSTKFNMPPCLDDTGATTFNVHIDVDIGNLPCGAQSLGDNQYKFAVVAGRLNRVYTFICDADDLPSLPTDVSDITFETPVLSNTLHTRNNPRDVKFQAIRNDVRIPTNSEKLGEEIKLRLTFDRKYTDNGPDNMGIHFHTAPLFQTAPVIDVTIGIITLSLGTRVHVTGSLVGNKIDEWRYVKVGNPGYVSIPVEYVTSSNGPETGLIEEKGLKIESIDARVGVTLTTTTIQDASKIIVLPDKVLDTRYRLSAIEDWYVTIVGTTDGTTLNITTNTFNMAAGDITLDGGTVAVDLTAVPLDEGDTLTINCGSNAVSHGCTPVFVHADQPVAVIVGGAASSGQMNEMVCQIPGLSSYSTRFINHQHYASVVYYFFSDTFEDDDVFLNTTVGSGILPVGVGLGIPEGVHILTDSNVLVILKYNSASISPLPTIEQWSLYQSIFLRAEPPTHYLYILTTAGNLASITFDVYGISISRVSTNGTLGGISGFSERLISGFDVDIEEYVMSFRVNMGANNADNGMITFHAGASNTPFVIAYHETYPAPFTLVSAFGLRYPPINPCVPTMAGHDIHPDFASAYYTGPGDMLDNDCDGRVDEEWEDGLADLLDGDDLVDEDLALKTENAVGIHVTSLIVSNTADFTGIYTQTVHTLGCNVNSPRTAVGAISDFKHNSNLASIFDQFYVIETDAFKVFSWINDGTNPFNPVYFRLYFDFCYGTLSGSNCEKSCMNDNMRKRDIDGTQNFVDLMFDITTNNTKSGHIEEHLVSASDSEMKHPCLKQSTLWLPSTFILLMIIVQSVVIVILFYRRTLFTILKRKCKYQ